MRGSWNQYLVVIMLKTAFITGICGQDGAYLADFLLKKHYQVVGLSFATEAKDAWRLDYFGIRRKVRIYCGDVLDGSLIKKILKKYQPDEIYNLAGQSSVAKSWEAPEETIQTNCLGVIKLLNHINDFSPVSRLFQASSMEIYGDAEALVTERTKTYHPLHPYGVAKLAAHLLLQNYREQYGLFLCNGILSSHTSPLQSDFFVAKQIVRGVARIANHQAKKIILGNISIQRDWTFAGDVVKAMWLILQQKKPADFIICSGQRWSIKQFAEAALREIGVRQFEKYVSINPNRVRKLDVKDMTISSIALKKIGWKPKVSLSSLVKMMVNYELEYLKKYGSHKK